MLGNRVFMISVCTFYHLKAVDGVLSIMHKGHAFETCFAYG
jgi:hypothetical protein